MKSPILIWDIESTDLKADWGRVLCIGFKTLDSAAPPRVWAVTDPEYRCKSIIDDRKLVAAFWKRLCEAPIFITYYGSRFDLPYLQAKVLKYGISGTPRGRHIDLYFYARQHMAISRRRLVTVAEYLDLKTQKSPVVGETWQLARSGDHAAMKYVVDHCRADVLVLEEAYKRLLPVVSRWGPCPSCGNPVRANRGVRFSVDGARRRLQCTTCGHKEQVQVRQ